MKKKKPKQKNKKMKLEKINNESFTERKENKYLNKNDINNNINNYNNNIII